MRNSNGWRQNEGKMRSFFFKLTIFENLIHDKFQPWHG